MGTRREGQGPATSTSAGRMHTSNFPSEVEYRKPSRQLTLWKAEKAGMGPAVVMGCTQRKPLLITSQKGRRPHTKSPLCPRTPSKR